MTVGVFMVVSFRQIAELPAKAPVAGIVLAGRARAIAPPVAEALGNSYELRAVGKYGPAFPHRDVMRGIKA